MLSDPSVNVECNQCGGNDDFGLTLLASESWNLQHIDDDLKAAGWIVLLR